MCFWCLFINKPLALKTIHFLSLGWKRVENFFTRTNLHKILSSRRNILRFFMLRVLPDSIQTQLAIKSSAKSLPFLSENQKKSFSAEKSSKSGKISERKRQQIDREMKHVKGVEQAKNYHLFTIFLRSAKNIFGKTFNVGFLVLAFLEIRIFWFDEELLSDVRELWRH